MAGQVIPQIPMHAFRVSLLRRFAATRARRVSFLLGMFSFAFGSGSSAADVKLIRDVAFLEPGRAEKLDLYVPARGADEPLAPAVIWIHGGGFTGSDKADAREKDVCSNLAATGYVCASVNYRLGDGSWPTNVFDCKNAVRFLRVRAAEFRVDPARIAVMGGSAGAVLAQWVGFTTGEKDWEPSAPYPGVSSAVAAVGTFYGSTDFLTREKPSPTGALTGQPGDLSVLAKVFGIEAGAAPSVWRALSPISHITSSSPPVLILHGLADANSAYSQSLELARALADKGVSHELIMLAGVGHSFGLTHRGKNPLPRNLTPAVVDFLKSCGLAPSGRG